MPLRGGPNVWVRIRRLDKPRRAAVLCPHHHHHHHHRHNHYDRRHGHFYYHHPSRPRQYSTIHEERLVVLDTGTHVTYRAVSGPDPPAGHRPTERADPSLALDSTVRAEPPPSDQELLWDIVLVVTGGTARYHEKYLIEFLARPTRHLRYMAAQRVVRRNEDIFPHTVRTAILSDAKYARLLAIREVKHADVEYWASILEAPSSAERTARFLASPAPKPEFLLRVVLRGDATFTEKAQLEALLHYAFVTHWKGACTWTRDRGRPMRWFAFVDLVGRFVFHSRRRWPQLLPIVALLAQSYLSNGDPAVGFRSIVGAYNWMLRIFGQPAFHRAAYNMQHNWRAQQTLLTAGERIGHDMLMERETYRAVRTVLLACKKTYEEQDLATRHVESWPPYVPPRDHMDERREPTYDYSSAVQVGFIMRGAGFEFEDGDVMLDILGGSGEDGSITIRQRRPVSERAVATASRRNVWAARVAATRNAREAWGQFQRPPEGHPEGAPTPAIVYAEMFCKLLDPEVSASQTDLQPGDGPVEFPVRLHNLSPYGEAASRPPKLRELYFSMLRDGVRPEGHCLAALLRSPCSLRAANGYLINSTLDPRAVRNMMSGRPVGELLRKLDVKVVFAYVRVLCRLQAHHKHRYIKNALHRRGLNYIGRAYRIMLGRVNATQHPTWFRSFGGEILNSLARPDRLIDARLNKGGNLDLALAKFMGMFTMLRARAGIDVAMFESLRCIVQISVEKRVQRAYDASYRAEMEIRSFFYADLVREGDKDEDNDFNNDDNEDDMSRRRRRDEWFSRFQGFVPRNEAQAKALVLDAVRALKMAFREMVSVSTRGGPGTIGPTTEALDSMTSLSNIVKSPFSQREPGGDAFWRPPPQEAAQAAVLHRYMRTLAFVGCWDEMMWLLGWMAGVGDERTARLYGGWDESDVLDRERGWGMTHAIHTKRALCAFRAFAEPALKHGRKHEVDSLVARVTERKCGVKKWGAQEQEGQWLWPTKGDVNEYLKSDTRVMMGKMLARVIKATRRNTSPWGAKKMKPKKAVQKEGGQETGRDRMEPQKMEPERMEPERMEPERMEPEKVAQEDMGQETGQDTGPGAGQDEMGQETRQEAEMEPVQMEEPPAAKTPSRLWFWRR